MIVWDTFVFFVLKKKHNVRVSVIGKLYIMGSSGKGALRTHKNSVVSLAMAIFKRMVESKVRKPHKATGFPRKVL